MKKFQRTTGVFLICLLSVFVFSFGEINVGAYTQISAEIPVTCLEIAQSRDHVYKIRIEAENNDSPAPVPDVLEISQNSGGKFEINVTEPGVFKYRIYEIPGSDPKIKYDSRVFEVTVFVENGEGDELKYSVSAKIAGSKSKASGIGFNDTVLGDTDMRTTTQPSATVTTTQPSAPVTTTTSGGNNPITGFINRVSIHAVGFTLLAAVLIVVCTLLFRRDNSEEEDKNEK